jgi:hypothetical protein
MRPIRKISIATGILTLLASICAGSVIAHFPYISSPAQVMSRQFIDFVLCGDLQAAYRLMDKDVPAGATFTAFEAEVRQQLPLENPPVPQSVTFTGYRGDFQSYGNRLRRWLRGRKLDPDRASFDYTVGVPFEVRLASDAAGGWRIVYFQSHAM